MKKVLLGFFAALICFIALDFIWLDLLAKEIYILALQSRLKESFSPYPLLAFYLLYASAINYLVVLPNLTADALQIAVKGAFLGAATYGGYNLTNFAILQDWPLNITLIDFMWGILATSVSSLFAWMIIWQMDGNIDVKQMPPKH